MLTCLMPVILSFFNCIRTDQSHTAVTKSVTCRPSVSEFKHIDSSLTSGARSAYLRQQRSRCYSWGACCIFIGLKVLPHPMGSNMLCRGMRLPLKWLKLRLLSIRGCKCMMLRILHSLRPCWALILLSPPHWITNGLLKDAHWRFSQIISRLKLDMKV